MTGQPRTDAIILLAGGLALAAVGVMFAGKHPALQAVAVGIGAGAALAGGMAVWG